MELVGVVAMLMAAVSMEFGLSQGAIHRVGDSAGWTTIGNVDYKLWASSKNFQIGDTILFEYNPQFHNVMRVTHPMYRNCNTSNPLSTFTTGNDSITLTNHGHHFFFCGVPGHCQAGQKVDIHVINLSTSSPPTSSPEPPSTSASSLSPTVPASGVPGPSPNLAPSLPTAAASAVAAMAAVSVVAAILVGDFAF
ncbi:PREDICTED: mavicyanin [Tarenaya hassleriana]|uniref:mavicyanin n=1 Tax=Tarenaya hassleriana TaxID=28532 RepID=UPI00053C44E6|nr:PREDICTED: mavicyanin [Tarenaya hassleriana]